jgi:hypothetical protein
MAWTFSKPLAVLAAVVALAAGGLAPPPAAAAPAWTLTPQGYGPVKIGMSRAQVSRALGVKLSPRAEHEEDACESGGAATLPGMIFMFEEGRLTRISLYDESRVRTPRGIGMGASEAEVRRLYGGPALEEEEHTYVGAPGLYLTYWLVPGKSGVRFETDEHRRVNAIHAGTSSIRYIEGCL